MRPTSWTSVTVKRLIAVISFVLLAQLPNLHAQEAAPFHPVIPQVWDDLKMADLEIPLAHAEYSPKHLSEDFYYKIPVRPIYKSYPVYEPGREPQGYIEHLRTLEPQLAWRPEDLKTREDWIRAGELVFDSSLAYGSILLTPERLAGIEDLFVREQNFYDMVEPPIAADGTLPAYRYVIRERGKIEIGSLSCAMCHTRVMPDGNVVKGAQGNFPFDRAMAFAALEGGDAVIARNRRLVRLLWFVPWANAAYFDDFDQKGPEELARPFGSHLGGVITRHRAGPWAPISTPDIIGVTARKYLDHTGLQQNNEFADLMRYAALNQGGDNLSNFGGFVPMAELAGPDFKPAGQDRYSDEQLYALALYVESLQPPANPNAFDDKAQAGKAVFEREGCAACHTPPLYMNNMLTPAAGFTVPPAHRERYDILDVVVGTDPALSLDTRRGTGYYKVPSLKGVWYREFFGHTGLSRTLEDWFDSSRVRDDYKPTGAVPMGVETMAVSGHEFGLKLSPEDREVLIAFLKTL